MQKIITKEGNTFLDNVPRRSKHDPFDFQRNEKSAHIFLESKQENLKNVVQNHLRIFRFYNFGTFATIFEESFLTGYDIAIIPHLDQTTLISKHVFYLSK